jgi:hypothetical protein
MNQDIPFGHKIIWKLKVPLKIKIFLWCMQQGVILTKDNLSKKFWKGNLICCFCNSNETINHILFNCHHAKKHSEGNLDCYWTKSTNLGRIYVSHMVVLGLFKRNVCYFSRCNDFMLVDLARRICFNNAKYNSFLKAVFRRT